MSTKPAILQANNRGAWKTVTNFSADDEVISAQVMDAAETLGRIDGQVKFRIVTNNGLQVPLMIWSTKDGWKPWRTA